MSIEPYQCGVGKLYFEEEALAQVTLSTTIPKRELFKRLPMSFGKESFVVRTDLILGIHKVTEAPCGFGGRMNFYRLVSRVDGLKVQINGLHKSLYMCDSKEEMFGYHTDTRFTGSLRIELDVSAVTDGVIALTGLK
ncbi:MAG: hypothetical protein SP1CHLAM54_07970 [Chlamydiia bacterium]|nr:hypothetical protein [Chlamydiia bacterium]MCH9615703.1 hypothetical protein [Chlamydiia bacterium]MCH9628894.1 hypothetical protein [Chlamydiia bacterium]